MALELPHDRLDTASPVSSGGRESPVPRLWRGEEEDYSRDKSFRRYDSAISRALSLFDTPLAEWADYISFLSRLLKALQSHPQNIPVVPSKSLVARRLAQCLSPSLPSGVHQKAIEVYSYIFTLISPTGVARDLSLYLPGISPVLSFASLTVRSPFLTLLRTHILPLPPNILHPAAKSLILTILPGLEDEGSEDFEHTYKLLNSFRSALRPGGDSGDDSGAEAETEDGYFWQCFFLATITSPSRRLGALAYLVRELPKLGSGTSSPNDVPESEAKVSAGMLTTPEPSLLVRCFSAGLRDEQILIQRGFLDLLGTHLPLHAEVFRDVVSEGDLELLMKVASSVVARRDMSLNRRLWSWLLGPEPLPVGDERPTSSGTDKGSASKTEYFETHGLAPLSRSILALINADPPSASERAKPFRICLSLMDRWEIGGLVVPLVFLPAMRSVKRYQSEDGIDKKDFQEVLRSASVFFNGVESGLIWSGINSLVFSALGHRTLETAMNEDEVKGKEEKIKCLELVRFIIVHFNIREEEMLAIHIPLTALGIVCSVTAELEDGGEHYREPGPVNSLAVGLALELMGSIPTAVLSPKPASKGETQQGVMDDGAFLIRLQAFYTQHHGHPSLSALPLSPSEISQLFLHKSITLFPQALMVSYPSHVEPNEYSHAVEGAVANYASLLLLVLEKTSSTSDRTTSSTLGTHAAAEDITALYEVCKKVLQFSKMCGDNRLPFATASAILDIILALYPHALRYEQIYTLIPLFTRQFWERLDSRQVRYHVETVRCIWKLHHALCAYSPPGGEREVEGCLSSLMLKSNDSADAIGSFSVLWLHSQGQDKDRTVFWELITRPLFLVLDLLADGREEKWAEKGDAKRWVQSLTGESLALLFKVLAEEMADFPRFGKEFIGDWAADGKAISSHDREPVDCEFVVYSMGTFGNILRYATAEMWHVLGTFTFRMEQRSEEHGTPHSHGSFLTFFSHLSLRGMGGLGIGRGDSTMKDSVPSLNRASLGLLGQLWSDSNPHASSKDLKETNEDAAKVMCWWLDNLNAKQYNTETALPSEILEVLGRTLRLQSNFGASAFDAPAQGMDVELHNRHLHNETSSLRAHSQTPLKPKTLLEMLQTTTKFALSSRAAQGVISEWYTFIRDCVRLGLFHLEPLEGLLNAVLCSIGDGLYMLSQSFHQKRNGDKDTEVEYNGVEGEKSMSCRIDILECLLMKAHEIVHAEDILMLEAKGRKSTTREERGSEKGFLGGIFGSTDAAAGDEKLKDLPITPRQRVQVLITKAVESMFSVWHWADAAKRGSEGDSKHSFHYVSLKLRSRARKLLELLFGREPGPCMECMVTLWTDGDREVEKAALQMVNVLDGTQPCKGMGLLFELVYEKVAGPSTSIMDWQMKREKGGKESVTTTADLMGFLNEYTESLENDAVVECWPDTAAFLRDLLANPMTYRGILPALVKFLGLVGERISKTSRGKSDKAMRREVADLWLRLLTAVFTTNPSAWQSVAEGGAAGAEKEGHPRHQAQDIVSVLSTIALSMPQILHDNTLILQAANTISTSIIQPTVRAKNFPDNIIPTFLSLFHTLGLLGASQRNSASASLMKVYKRDVFEAFNHPSYFSNSSSSFSESWAGILRIWCQKDRDRIITDLLGRLVSPTTAGIVFGVGAASARMEADARTKSTLKRITTLILADSTDAWVAALPGIYAKVVELLTATTTSSPSSATRSDVYVLIRALIVRVSPIHLSFLWPSFNSELENCLSSCLPGTNSREAEREREVWDGAALVQGCKLLEGLLGVGSEEWQVGEWTFVRDGVDAIAAPGGEDAVALMDRLVAGLGNVAEEKNGLDFEAEGMEREEVIMRLQPFFAGLAKRQFESVLARLARQERSEKVEEKMWKGVVEDVFTSENQEDRKE